jgi:DNA helicase HerA-like ATPase/CRISPR/Cas system-associated exonuclease Cas4 (RecB family)
VIVMVPATFTVSEVRVAATCPRISYFDAEATRRKRLKARAVTRLWKAGDAETACGSLFHNTIEAFNRRGLDALEVRAAFEEAADPRAIEQRLRTYLNANCVNLDVLASKPAAQQQAFIRAVETYMGELADIVADARSRGKAAGEIVDHLFGDRRRRVDVTFQVGPQGEPVRITGTLDYVFYDWRTAHHRVIDYKLTPAGEPSNDLFQVALYALMHNVQHRTTPDVGVLYLHPERRMVELSWDQVHGQRYKLFDLLASLAEWVRYDETIGTGLKPPGEPSWCPHCKWDKQGQCLARLGPKHEGVRLRHWTDAAQGISGIASNEPAVGVREPTGPSKAWVSDVESEPEGEIIESTADSLRIGTTVSGGTPVDLPISALPTHVVVVGAAGSGKTWMAKVIVEEAVRLGLPVLAIDPQGDLVQFLRPAADLPGLSDAERSMRREFLDRVEPRIWTPGSSHGRRLCLDPIRLPGRDDLARVTDPARREEEWQGMLGVAAAQLVGLAKVGGETDSQQTFLLQVFRRLSSGRQGRDVTLEAIGAAVSDPRSIGLDDPDQLIKKAERTKLARKLHAMRLGPASALFTGGTRLDVDALRRPEETGKTPLNVFYLNALADDDLKHFFAAALAAEIYRWMITSADTTPGRPSLLFYLDEARDYIPAGTARPAAKGPLIRLFTQGRKYGVACLLCTQSPRSVDYNVFGNCSAKLVGRLESQQDVERVAQWFSTEGAVPPWVSGRKAAPAGSFVGRWPEMPAALEGQPLRSRPLCSLHEGAWSPDRLEREMRDVRAVDVS